MFTYILSGEINYELLICNDAGPGYALSMNWAPIYLNDIEQLSQETVILDPRVTENELNKIEDLIIRHPNTKFFLRIADPYREIYQDHFYYRFLVRMAKYANSFLLSTYEPKELVTDIKEKYYGNRFIHLPYPYIKSNEINTPRNKRNRVVLSGSINPHVYPYRTAIWRKVTRSVSRFFFFSILKHPGYKDVNPEHGHLHSLIKEKYIEYLSGFRYMLLCPSRCNIEFLKYSEAAYAGCIPVGLPPDSFPDDIKALFLPLRPEKFSKDIMKIIFNKHPENAVVAMRNFLHETRKPDTLNKALEDFIHASSIYIS